MIDFIALGDDAHGACGEDPEGVAEVAFREEALFGGEVVGRHGLGDRPELVAAEAAKDARGGDLAEACGEERDVRGRGGDVVEGVEPRGGVGRGTLGDGSDPGGEAVEQGGGRGVGQGARVEETVDEPLEGGAAAGELGRGGG